MDSSILSQNFKIIRKIGEGSYGIVYEAICYKNNNRVAIKKIKVN